MPYSTEQALQDAIEYVLQDHGISYSREHRLDPKNRLDFFVRPWEVCSDCKQDPYQTHQCGSCMGNGWTTDGTGIAVEVKIKGSAASIHRQLKRYASNSTVSAILLVTGKTVGMPAEVCGKKVVVLPVGKAWL